MAVQNLGHVPDSERDENGRPFKEDFKILDPNVLGLPWSEWKELISPVLTSHCLQRPGGHKGYYSPSLEAELNAEWKGCGVYELGLRKGRSTCKLAIAGFYVGSTCREGTDHSLGSRIFEYVRNGSHKAELINAAVCRNLTMYVRVIQTKDNNKARELEQYLLAKYNYAWNDNNNGQIRPNAINEF